MKIRTVGANLFHADGQTDRQTDRQADRQTGRQTDRQAGRQAGRQADRQGQTERDTQAGRHDDARSRFSQLSEAHKTRIFWNITHRFEIPAELKQMFFNHCRCVRFKPCKENWQINVV
jgi:hypothetical protein